MPHTRRIPPLNRSSSPAAARSSSFEASARVVIGEVRASLAALLESVGADATRPQTVSRQFGLNKNLTWKVSKVLGEESPQVAVTHLPGRPGMEILLQTFQQAGAPAERLTSLRSAIAALDQLVRTHAGNRETLAVMLGSFSERTEPLLMQKEEASRKLCYQGNSAIWGALARVQLSSHFVVPSVDPGRLDVAVVSGLIDFRRLRSDVAWPIATMRVGHDDGKGPSPLASRPLDPEVAAGEPPILREFCSQPIIPLRAEDGPAAHTRRFEISEGPVGNTAATTCILGRISPSLVSAWRTEEDRFGEHFTSLITPVETLVFDVFVHASLPLGTPPASEAPTISVYSQLPGVPAYPQGPRDRGLLPISEEIASIASLAQRQISDLPDYERIVERVCRVAGCSIDDFRGYRFRLRYPPMPALAVVRYPLPERSR